MSCPPADIEFLDRDYHYGLLATQIPRDTGLAPIPYTGRKIYKKLLDERFVAKGEDFTGLIFINCLKDGKNL